MLFVVTSKELCRDDFLSRIEKIASNQPERVILREKQLDEKTYFDLAKRCKEICQKYDVKFSVNSFVETARRLQCDLHISFQFFQENPEIVKEFDVVGVSVHSAEEAVLAETMGAKYVIFGHIFETDCKKDLLPRGTEVLRKTAESVKIPVMAIGGITPERVPLIYQSGAAGVCVMSGLMQCKYDEITDNMMRLNGGNQ